MRNNHAAALADFRQAAGHRFIVSENAVTVQLDPFGKAARNVIERKRPLHMPGDLHPLPGVEILVNLPARVADLRLHRFDFALEIDLVVFGMVLQILQPALQFEDRFFEIERLRTHSNQQR